MIIISISISIILILFTYILNKKSYNYEKTSAIECGIEPFEEEIGIETRERFYLKFYIIGITYLIFDLESILLYPITIYSHNLSNFIFSSGGFTLFISIFYFFMFIIILGLFYEIKKKVL